MDRAKFFAGIRTPLFGGALKPEQVQRIECLLDAFEDAGWPLAWAAYALATAHHETAKWQHMKELGGTTYFMRMYDKSGSRPHMAEKLGNTEVSDGAKYPGRGFVQLTGRANHRRAGNAIGVDLLSSPQLAEKADIAARILIWGMQTGAYTGKANSDYLNKTPPDYLNARRIINGTDRAELIADYALRFQAALKAAGYGSVAKTTIVSPGVEGESLPKAPYPTPIDPAPKPPLTSPEPTRHDGEHKAPPRKTLIQRLAAIFGN